MLYEEISTTQLTICQIPSLVHIRAKDKLGSIVIGFLAFFSKVYCFAFVFEPFLLS